MAFLNPLVLLGLAAAAIPLLVHLFNFRRPQRVDFPSLRFVRELERKAMRRVRVRQWLLLALRTAAIAALVLAFARPALPSAWRAALGARPPAAVALVVDNSRSMTLRDARGALLDQARATAAALAEAAPPGDALTLVPTAPPPGAPPALAPTPAPVLDALDALPSRHGAESLTEAVARAAAALAVADHPAREVFVVGDLQAATLADSAAAPMPEGVRVTLMPVGARRHANTAVTDVRVESRLVEPGRPVRLAATLTRWGEAAEAVAVRVLLDGEPVGEGAVDLQPGEPGVVRLTVTPPRPGWLRGEVRLAEGDDADWDDARFFALEVPAARRVLLVRGPGQRADFARLALGLGAETGALVVTETEALPAGRLADYDAVVLLGPQRIAGGEVAALTRYVEAGGGVLLAPHERPDAASYTALFRALGGGRLDGLTGTLDGPPTGGLADADLEHPLLDGLLDDGSGDRRLESPEIALAARYVPGGGDEATVVRMASGAPFLHEIRRGQGALLWLAVAPDPRWSDFPTRGLFAPLLLRSVAYLAGTGGAAADALTAGRPGTIRVEGAAAGDPLQLVAPDGVALEPPQRAVPGAVLLDVEDVERPGVYSVRRGDDVLRLVAVNPDARESDPRPLAPEEAARRLEALWGREVAVLDARGAAGAEALEREGRGAPLWTVFLLIALACLVAETVVAMRWKGEGAG